MASAVPPGCSLRPHRRRRPRAPPAAPQHSGGLLASAQRGFNCDVVIWDTASLTQKFRCGGALAGAAHPGGLAQGLGRPRAGRGAMTRRGGAW
jgi:hypothetical protein